jgi:hypothetical protein
LAIVGFLVSSLLYQSVRRNATVTGKVSAAQA